MGTRSQQPLRCGRGRAAEIGGGGGEEKGSAPRDPRATWPRHVLASASPRPAQAQSPLRRGPSGAAGAVAGRSRCCRCRSRSGHGAARRPRGAPGQPLPGPRRGAAPARPRERGAGRLQPLRERRGEPGVGPGPAVSRGRLPGALPGARRVAAGRSRRLSASLSVPQPPPPPYHAPAGAPPAVGVPPPQGTAQPPRRPSPTEPRNYGSYGTQASAAAATAELLKRQEELNRKAEELDRRERELQNAALGSGATRLNNWPPLPSFCPVKPCFYQDIPVEIPADFQKTVSTMYYLWMASTIALFLNFLSSLAWFCVDPSSGSGFGLSILWALLYTPCSFVCWYRPMYKAFRSDSSFNFFVFFFVFFAQNVMYVLQAIGIPNWGFSGWILSLIALRKNTAVAVMMILVSLFFTAVAVLGIIMLKKIHSLYRRTGASFQKAQEEFAAGVFSNQAVRTAAANAAAGAATNAFRAP
uniref:Secretory carrier-associated membrane protein n=1 Tax=Anas platyrhynchos platyrhynchos TaxID=8840 RepID=A0A493TA91_ANAPP